jgi:hypothetical protein
MYRRHAWERMESRGISVSDILQVLDSAEEIEQYREDTPFPTRPCWRASVDAHCMSSPRLMSRTK